MKKLLVVALALAPATARADGIAEIMTTKSIPKATVAIIDPESGTSQGGAGSDVKYAIGDVLSFRFRYFPVPDNNGSLDGMQSYLTEYIPANTDVVGVRILSGDDLPTCSSMVPCAQGNCSNPAGGVCQISCSSGLTCVSGVCTSGICDDPIVIRPRYPGISVDQGGTNTGSISEVYADTGVFLTQDGRLARNPANMFLQFTNGSQVVPSPAQAANIAALVGADRADVRAHNAWDLMMADAFGVGGVPAEGRASPVAGTGSFYQLDGTTASIGPWRRMKYAGSLIGTELSGNQDVLRRTVTDASTLGFDLTPATVVDGSIAKGAKAVRIALGDIRVGRPGVAEVSLRVTGTPLEPSMGKDTDCAEIFGGDSSKRSPNVTGPGAGDNPWATFLPAAACVYLNLLFDLHVDDQLAVGGQTLTWTLHGRNLSTQTQQGAVIYVGYDPSRGQVVFPTGGVNPDGTAAGQPTQVTCPTAIGASGLTCLRWSLGTLAPSADYTRTVRWSVGGGGQVTNVFRALYTSTTPSVSFATQELALVQAAPVLDAQFNLPAVPSGGFPPGSALTVSGNLFNRGSGAGTLQQVGVFAPSGWTVGNIVLPGVGSCSGSSSTGEFQCGNINHTLAANTGTQAMTFSVTPPAGTPVGLYPVHVNMWVSASSFGGDAENLFPNVVLVPVGQVRSDKPQVDCPNGELGTATVTVTGTTTEADGTTIRVYFDGILRCTTTASGGTWSCTGFSTTFGSLYGGIEIRATAQAPGELESELSDPCDVVQSRPACNDGIDNDGDGRIDFPDDPGCTSLGDNDETNVGIQCSDGIDNDGNGLTDWPADKGCYGPNDPIEKPECSDGIDNDGDGLIDSADPDCRVNGVYQPNKYVEAPAPQCSDGWDNDGDGKIDFPDDPGCDAPNDDDEIDPSISRADVPPRLLLLMDTSGSMNWNVCATEPLRDHVENFTGGDGTIECRGHDVSPSLCASATSGDGLPNDGRLFKIKKGVREVIAAFGEVDFGMMRFFQRAVTPFNCPDDFPTNPSGAWQGGGGFGSGAARQCPGFAAGEVLVRFTDEDNRYDMLQWLDNDESGSAGARPLPRLDFELRGTGTTPLAGSLQSALEYMQQVQAADSHAGCRPYRVILLTDGAETCGGVPAAAAAALLAAGIKVSVIGFATDNQDIQNQLNAIAVAGGTGTAIFVDDEIALSSAMSDIISASIKKEICNNIDDDCDGLIDEGFGGFPKPSCNNGLLGVCALSGQIACLDENTTYCKLDPCPRATCSPSPEVCNQLDDDCDGLVDEDANCPINCTTEICNGVDDNCNGQIDEGTLPGVGDPCGIDTGECSPGHLVCHGLQGLLCDGAVGPVPEICDNKDNDCDGIVDSMVSLCYPAGTPGCVPATPPATGYVCQGICAAGLTTCVAGVQSPCSAITPAVEKCNGIDDDCNGVIDDNFHSGEDCFSNGIGACRTKGKWVCSADGLSAFCTAPVVTGTPEVCDGIDNDCNGLVDDHLGSPIGEPCGGQGTCGAGTFICDSASGTIVCSGGGTGTVEVCDGKDNDCDGFIDELPLPGAGDPCPPPGLTLPLPANSTCMAGTMMCIPNATGGASMQCIGYAGPSKEICDGKDNDCDGVADDFAECPSPEDACIQGQCVRPCEQGEFACPFGFRCRVVPEEGNKQFCLPYPCDYVTCPLGTVCNPATVKCEDPCALVTCSAPLRCFNGKCENCRVTGCPAGQVCVPNATGALDCQVDKCATVTCDPGKYCRDGACYSLTCEPACGEGFDCIDGQCQPRTCDPANCEGRACAVGLACNPSTGICIPDPCGSVTCPTNFECAVTCGGVPVCNPSTVPPEQLPGVDVLATGGGGFSCEIGAVARGGGTAGLWLLGLLGAVIAATRRRSRPSK